MALELTRVLDVKEDRAMAKVFQVKLFLGRLGMHRREVAHTRRVSALQANARQRRAPRRGPSLPLRPEAACCGLGAGLIR